MFKRGWLRRNYIYSDEGFSVQIVGRDSIVYREGTRRMAITSEMTLDGFAIHSDTIGRWDDDPGHKVGEQKQQEIMDRIKRALKSQKEEVHLL